MNPQPIDQAWTFLTQALEDHRATLSPAAGEAFRVVAAQQLGVLAPLVKAALQPPPAPIKKRRRRKAKAKPKAAPAP